jgi:hypothetical protein
VIRGGWKLCCSLAVSGRIQWNFALTTGCGRALGNGFYGGRQLGGLDWKEGDRVGVASAWEFLAYG